MLKTYITFALVAFLLLGVTTTSSEARTNKNKSVTKSDKAKVLEDQKKANNKKKYKNKKKRKVKTSKNRRYKRSGTGPDLRALTTEKPNDEYIQNPDNGVNPVEMKAEL